MSSTLELTLDQLVLEIKAIYDPLLGNTFEGSIHETNTTAVSTGGPRHVVNVHDVQVNEEVIELMKTIVAKVDEVSKKYEPFNPKEKVWKGITLHNGRLWVKSLEENGPIFRVANIEVVTDLNWQRSYHAIVNITLD